jgi:type VI secretion system protein VasL
MAGGGETAHNAVAAKFNAAALPVDAMNSWYQGMMLQQLSHRLSSLDEQKGKYITVSELKSVVFDYTVI